MSSHAIARWADARGSQPTLFPPDHLREIDEWSARSDVVMEAGRARLLRRMLDDDAALAEQLPPFVPAGLRSELRFASRVAIQHLVRKYATDRRSDDEDERAIATALEDARASGLTSGTATGGAFTYADIAFASALQFVRPVAERYISLGTATRAVWTDEPIATAFSDLLTWRDRLYEHHRRPAA